MPWVDHNRDVTLHADGVPYVPASPDPWLPWVNLVVVVAAIVAIVVLWRLARRHRAALTGAALDLAAAGVRAARKTRSAAISVANDILARADRRR